MGKHHKYMALLDDLSDLRDKWAKDSNETGVTTQAQLNTICEQFIDDLDDLLRSYGGHPGNPKPRIRP